MKNDKNAFLLLESIISISIISLVILSLFNVKDNTSLFMTRINKKSIENSLIAAFLPFSEKENDKNKKFLELFDVKDEKLKKKLESFVVNKKENLLNDKNNNSKSNIDFYVKAIEVKNKNSKKTFYSFILN